MILRALEEEILVSYLNSGSHYETDLCLELVVHFTQQLAMARGEFAPIRSSASFDENAPVCYRIESPGFLI